jgi:hypothetical protein
VRHFGCPVHILMKIIAWEVRTLTTKVKASVDYAPANVAGFSSSSSFARYIKRLKQSNPQGDVIHL